MCSSVRFIMSISFMCILTVLFTTIFFVYPQSVFCTRSLKQTNNKIYTNSIFYILLPAIGRGQVVMREKPAVKAVLQVFKASTRHHFGTVG